MEAKPTFTLPCHQVPPNIMRTILPFCVLIILMTPVSAQDFERAYTSDNQSVDISNACLLGDGGYALAGLEYSGSSFIVSRTDQNGVPIWTRAFTPQMGFSLSTASAVGQFANGDIYVLANGYSSNTDTRFLLRFSSNGDQIWSKQLQFANLYDMDYTQRAAKVLEQTNGDILLSIPATMDPVIAKLNSSGAPLWAKSFTSTEDTLYDKHPTFDCEPTDDGGFVLCGKDRDWPFVMKVDANGNVVWNQTYYQVSTYSHLRNMEILPNGDLLFAGLHETNGMMMRMSPTGTILWMKDYPAEYYFESMRSLGDGTYIIGSAGYGSVAHVNADGDVLGYFTPASSTSPGLFCFSGSNGKAHMAGYVYNTLNWFSGGYMTRFDPATPPACLYAPATLTSTDVPSVANTTGTTTMLEQIEPMVVTDMNLVFVGTSLADDALCGIAAGVEERPVTGVTVLPSLVASGQPLNVDLGPLQKAVFQWVAANGALVQQQTLNASKGALSTNGLAPGLYTLLATDNGALVHTARIVVE